MSESTFTADHTKDLENPEYKEAHAAAEQDLRRKAVEAALDDFGRMALERLVGQVNARNADVDRLNSIGGDRISRLDEKREALTKGEGSQDLVNLEKQIQTLLDKVGDLQEQRDKALNAEIDAEDANSDVDPAALDEAVKTADASIRSGLNYAVGIYGEDFKLLLPEQKSRKGSRKSGSGGSAGGGSGKRRLRGFDVYVNDVKATSPDKDGVQKSSFSAAAKVIGLNSVDPLSGAYRQRNGDDPEKFPAEDTFEFEHEGTSFKVRAVRA